MDRYTSPFSTSIRGIKGLIPRKMPAHGPVFGINLNSWRHTPAELRTDMHAKSELDFQPFTFNHQYLSEYSSYHQSECRSEILAYFCINLNLIR
jgi:hypothetical protein